jgi:hypothetical protein
MFCFRWSDHLSTHPSIVVFGTFLWQFVWLVDRRDRQTHSLAISPSHRFPFSSVAFTPAIIGEMIAIDVGEPHICRYRNARIHQSGARQSESKQGHDSESVTALTVSGAPPTILQVIPSLNRTAV